MQSDNALFDLKSKPEPLLAALNITRAGNHCPCPICKDKTSLRVGEKDGVWLWQCMRGCGAGTVIDALALLDGKDPKQVIRELFGNGNGHSVHGNGHCPANGDNHGHNGNGNGSGKSNGNGIHTVPATLPVNGNGHDAGCEPFPSRPVYSHPVNRIKQYSQTQDDLPRQEPPPPPLFDPQIDIVKAEAFIQMAYVNLVSREELVDKWLQQKRGISVEIAVAFRLGFLESFRLERWPDWELHNAWVLPITDEHDKLKAVKLHFETPPKPGMKCIWAPFGTQPKDKPLSSYLTLWPHPNSKLVKNLKQKPEEQKSIHWWLERASAQARASVEEKLKWTSFEVANKYSLTVEELNPDQKEEALVLAFNECRHHVERSVLNACSATKTGALQRFNVICPGELKALAYLSAGVKAASVTGGEGADLPLSALLSLRGRRVGVEYDDDLPRTLPTGKIVPPAGTTFRDKLVKALFLVKPREVRTWTRGRGITDNGSCASGIPNNGTGTAGNGNGRTGHGNGNGNGSH